VITSTEEVASLGIVAVGLTKRFRGSEKPLFREASLSITEPGTLGIIGPNGAGKTTLMGCLLGFVNPTAGSVLIDGVSPRLYRLKHGLGYVPERCVLDPQLTVEATLRFYHSLAGLPRARRDGEVLASLEAVEFPEALTRKVALLSRGALQRLALAQALLGSPRYLFLDEPLLGLDPEAVVSFRRLIRRLNERGCIVILNSHRLEEVEEVCGEVLLLRNERLLSVRSRQSRAGEERILRIRLLDASRSKEYTELISRDALGSSIGAVSESEGDILVVLDPAMAVHEAIKLLSAAGVPFVAVTPEPLLMTYFRGKDVES
jgi:ABC-type multidrug transport system ATPase subunit